MLLKILEDLREMDELVEFVIQEDLQSSPYNTPVDTHNSSHSRDSYVIDISRHIIVN